MRKILVLLLVSFTMLAQAQKAKVVAAATALSSQQIKEAKTLITEAFSDPTVATMAKAWKTKAEVFVEVYKLNMEELLSEPKSLDIALEAYKKAYDLDMAAEKKPGRYKTTIQKGMFTVARGYFEKAVTKFGESQFETAMNGFMKSSEVIKYLEDKSLLADTDKEDAKLIVTDAYQNGALCALNIPDYIKAAEFYNKLIGMGIEDEKIYANLASIYISQSDYDNANTIIEKGRAKFPTNESLIESELNYYIGTDQSDKAIGKLINALEAKPGDPDLTFNLALAYDKMGDKAKMIESYEKIIATNPDYTAAYLNLGAYYNEKANEVITTMNGMTDWQEQVKLEPQRDEWYNKALPFLEKAYQLDKDNPGIKRALQRIYANFNMMDKIQELKGN